jgi:NAD(P)-dependent dehydrogenase (short-subunit alcohol dehydrogenase family)
MTALVTGFAGGIGRAIVAKLHAEGFEVKELDLVTGFDVADAAAWEHVGSVDLACLNAGVLTGGENIATLTDEQYRRAVGVNVDGVVYGVRRLDRVMPTGSTIVVTASLAGLVGIPDDPIYGLTKHAVVGFVRLLRHGRARGSASGAVLVGRHGADTPEFGRPPSGGSTLLSRRNCNDVWPNRREREPDRPTSPRGLSPRVFRSAPALLDDT